MGPSGCDVSDLPEPQPSQVFACSLVEGLGRTDRLRAKSPRCLRDASQCLGKGQPKKKARRGSHAPGLHARVPKSEVL